MRTLPVPSVGEACCTRSPGVSFSSIVIPLGAMSVFGWNVFSLRALTWVTLAGTLWIFWLWAKRLKPEDPGAWWWPSAAVYLSSLLFFLMSGVTFHDHAWFDRADFQSSVHFDASVFQADAWFGSARFGARTAAGIGTNGCSGLFSAMASPVGPVVTMTIALAPAFATLVTV